MRKKASLLTDMADRAMYGALGGIGAMQKNIRSVNTDLILIDKAISGVKNLLTYGLMACFSEMTDDEEIFNEYFGDIARYRSLNYEKIGEFSNNRIGEYKGLLGRFIEGFMDKRWKLYYGGTPWKNIALGLKNILVNYEKYLRADGEEKIRYGNQTINSMNLFDNAAHNTGNIFDKMLEQKVFMRMPEMPLVKQQEVDIEYLLGYGTHDESLHEHFEEIDKITRIMDSKNLKNPYAALVEAEKNLDMDLPYKEDYLSKIRGTKDYAEAKGEDVSDELRVVRTSKKAIPHAQGAIDLLTLANENIKKSLFFQAYCSIFTAEKLDLKREQFADINKNIEKVFRDFIKELPKISAAKTDINELNLMLSDLSFYEQPNHAGYREKIDNIWMALDNFNLMTNDIRDTIREMVLIYSIKDINSKLLLNVMKGIKNASEHFEKNILKETVYFLNNIKQELQP